MFYKQNGIVAGILLLILFAGAIGLVSVQMDKTVNRMHYSVVEEMGVCRIIWRHGAIRRNNSKS